MNNEFIVKYYDLFLENNCFNIVMEYCENLSLKDFIDNHDKSKLIDPNVIYCIINDICMGLTEIHKQNLIHRDLKPANLFIDKNYKIKIGDFGSSKQFSDLMKYAGTQIGTIEYMAPEIIKGEKYNQKVDIWALGCIFYELCKLEKCFPSNNLLSLCNKIVNGDHGKIDIKFYNTELQNLIDSMLNINYKERPDINKVYELILNIWNKNFMDKISLNILKRIMNDKDLNTKIHILKEMNLKNIKKNFIDKNFVEDKISYLEENLSSYIEKDFDEKYIESNSFINANFIQNENNKLDDEDEEENIRCIERESNSGILKICFLKYISININDNDINQISSPLKEIIKTLKKPIKLTNIKENAIKDILSNIYGNNILEYSKYINHIINNEKIIELINVFDINEKEKLNKIWTKFMKYEELMTFLKRK